MLAKDDRIRITHMLDAAEKIVEHCSGKSFADAEQDYAFQCLLVRCLEVIGEAASQITEGTFDEYPRLPWRKMIGMRNRLAHAYFDIDIEIIWKTATEEIPALTKDLYAILAAK